MPVILDYMAASPTLSLVGLSLALIFVVDRIYQRFSHKWTGEPPLLPYLIPIIGHGLKYGKDRQELYKEAALQFPNCEPYSLLFFGSRVYVFTHPKDVSIIFRKPRELPFLPLIEKFSGLAWGISPTGMALLSQQDEKGDSLFRNAHAFYRDKLKAGPELDKLTVSFLGFLEKAFDNFEKDMMNDDNKNEGQVRFRSWNQKMLGVAGTNAMMGTSLLNYNPKFIESVFKVDSGFVFFVNKVPRMFAREIYEARDLVLKTLTRYFNNPDAVNESVPMIKEREVQMRQKGMAVEDIAAYSFSAYVAFVTNAVNTAFKMSREIYHRPEAIDKIRAEIAPAFSAGPTITTLDQVHYLLTSCPLLRAYFDETLRLYTSTPSNRRVVEETEISTYTLKEGHNLMCPAFIQHHNPDYFGLDTDAFSPERFLEPTLTDGKPANPSMLRAFGGGISLCSGRHFASNEVLSYVASLFWRYDIEPVGEGMVKIRRREM